MTDNISTWTGGFYAVSEDQYAILLAVPEDFDLDQMKKYEQVAVTATDPETGTMTLATDDTQKVYRLRFARRKPPEEPAGEPKSEQSRTDRLKELTEDFRKSARSDKDNK